MHFFDIWTSKSGPNPWCALYILTSKCASRHNGVHFLDISTFKSGPTMVCFVHFDLEMCFAPQRRALFRHLNFQKWSENGVLCTFWLGNVLGATTACNCSSLIWPAGSAPAALSSLLFDPPEPQIIGKTVFRDFPTFSRICIFFLLTLSLLLFSLLIFLFSLTLSISAFHLSILSEVWLLNFLRYNIWYRLISYRVYYITSFMYLFTWFTYCQFFSWILYHTHTDIVIHQGTSCWASSSGGAQELLKVSIFCRNLSAFRGPIAKVFQTSTFCQQCAGYARSPNDCHTCKWAVDGVKKTKTHEKMWWGRL